MAKKDDIDPRTGLPYTFIGSQAGKVRVTPPRPGKRDRDEAKARAAKAARDEAAQRGRIAAAKERSATRAARARVDVSIRKPLRPASSDGYIATDRDGKEVDDPVTGERVFKDRAAAVRAARDAGGSAYDTHDKAFRDEYQKVTSNRDGKGPFGREQLGTDSNTIRDDEKRDRTRESKALIKGKATPRPVGHGKGVPPKPPVVLATKAEQAARNRRGGFGSTTADDDKPDKYRKSSEGTLGEQSTRRLALVLRPGTTRQSNASNATEGKDNSAFSSGRPGAGFRGFGEKFAKRDLPQASAPGYNNPNPEVSRLNKDGTPRKGSKDARKAYGLRYNREQGMKAYGGPEDRGVRVRSMTPREKGSMPATYRSGGASGGQPRDARGRFSSFGGGSVRVRKGK